MMTIAKALSELDAMQPSVEARIMQIATAYPYAVLEVLAVYVACHKDIDATELVVRLSVRPIDSRTIARMLDTLRGNR